LFYKPRLQSQSCISVWINNNVVNQSRASITILYFGQWLYYNIVFQYVAQ
jgi:hypothetical protein